MTDITKPAQNDATLKPCPFCGGDAEMDIQRGYSYYPPSNETGQEVAIYCTQCGSEIAVDPNEIYENREAVVEQLIQQWNERTTDAARIAQLEADHCCTSKEPQQ